MQQSNIIALGFDYYQFIKYLYTHLNTIQVLFCTAYIEFVLVCHKENSFCSLLSVIVHSQIMANETLVPA